MSGVRRRGGATVSETGQAIETAARLTNDPGRRLRGGVELFLLTHHVPDHVKRALRKLIAEYDAATTADGAEVSTW